MFLFHLFVVFNRVDGEDTTLSQQATCSLSLLKSEERLAEQRLNVLQLLAEMSADEPSLSVGVAVHSALT
jgi:hypothetical protein